MLLQPAIIKPQILPQQRISFKGKDDNYQELYKELDEISRAIQKERNQVKETPKKEFGKKIINAYKNAKKSYKAILIGLLATFSFTGGYLARPIIIEGENNKIEELKKDINSQQNKLDSINNTMEKSICKNNETIEKQDKMIRTLDSTYNAKLAEFQSVDSILNSNNKELSEKLDSLATVENVYDPTVIDKKAIAQMALKIFKKLREHNSLYGTNETYNEQLVFDGNKIMIAYKTKGIFRDDNMVTRVNINKDGDFSMDLNGYDSDDGDEEGSFKDSHGIVNGKRTPEGFYHVTWSKYDGYHWKNSTYLCDYNNKDVSNSDIIKRKKQILHSKFQSTLNNIENLDNMNKNMISAILAGNNINKIDCVKEGNKNIIYCDIEGASVEIRFFKKDAKTAYGAYIVTQNNSGNVEKTMVAPNTVLVVTRKSSGNVESKIYAFKYTDQSTPNTQRINLTTKRDVNGELFNSSVLDKKTQSIYEKFLSEGANYATYTQNNESYYRNGEKMF